MNNIRTSEPLPRVWLEVNINKSDEHGYTVSSTLFDGTPFSIYVPKLKVDVNPTDEKKGLLEVGRVGKAFGYVEVTLPAPALQFGYQARVLEVQLVNPTPKVVTGTKYRKEE
jgi:hypothetical protein